MKLFIDRQFHGVTVLFAPPAEEHEIHVLAVPGLGGHAFGSFTSKSDGYMWLRDDLPLNIPSARIMVYSYDSGLENSDTFAHIGNLASSLHITICRLL